MKLVGTHYTFVKIRRIRAKIPDRMAFEVPELWTHTHTHKKCEGTREGTRTASDRGNKRKEQTKADNRQGEHTTSRQNKGRKKGGERGKKHTGARPWHPEEQTAQSRTGNKAKTAARQLKQDSTGKEQTHS